MVSISGCDPLDPGSTPGTANFFFEKKMQSVGIEPTLLRTCALSMRLNHSAKTATGQTKKHSDPRGNRTPNLRVWNPTRYHCAMEPSLVPHPAKGKMIFPERCNSRLTIQRRLAWPLRKDDTHKSRKYTFSFLSFLFFSTKTVSQCDMMNEWCLLCCGCVVCVVYTYLAFRLPMRGQGETLADDH